MSHGYELALANIGSLKAAVEIANAIVWKDNIVEGMNYEPMRLKKEVLHMQSELKEI